MGDRAGYRKHKQRSWNNESTSQESESEERRESKKQQPKRIYEHDFDRYTKLKD